jgi:hypothetical protein
MKSKNTTQGVQVKLKSFTTLELFFGATYCRVIVADPTERPAAEAATLPGHACCPLH